MILRYYCPAVSQFPYRGLASVDHGFDGEDHAWLERQAYPALSIVQDLRIFVKFSSDAMTAELSNDAVTTRLRMILDRSTDVSEIPSRPNGADAKPKAFMRDPAKSLSLNGNITDFEHSAGVAVEAVLYHRDVDVDDIALPQDLVTRHAMAHLMIDRGAYGLWVWLVTRRGVVERRRNDFLKIHHEIMAKSVHFPRRDPWLNLWCNVI